MIQNKQFTLIHKITKTKCLKIHVATYTLAVPPFSNPPPPQDLWGNTLYNPSLVYAVNKMRIVNLDSSIIKALTIHTMSLTCQFVDHQEFTIFCSHVSQHMQRKIIRMQWNAYSFQKIYQGDEPSTLILLLWVMKE